MVFGTFCMSSAFQFEYWLSLTFTLFGPDLFVASTFVFLFSRAPTCMPIACLAHSSFWGFFPLRSFLSAPPPLGRWSCGNFFAFVYNVETIFGKPKTRRSFFLHLVFSVFFFCASVVFSVWALPSFFPFPHSSSNLFLLKSFFPPFCPPLRFFSRRSHVFWGPRQLRSSLGSRKKKQQVSASELASKTPLLDLDSFLQNFFFPLYRGLLVPSFFPSVYYFLYLPAHLFQLSQTRFPWYVLRFAYSGFWFHVHPIFRWTLILEGCFFFFFCSPGCLMILSYCSTSSSG